MADMAHHEEEDPALVCVECHEPVDTDRNSTSDFQEECMVSHCEQTMILHPDCARQRDPLICRYHMTRYRRTRLTRWMVGLGCGLILLGGTAAAGYGSATLANSVSAFFSYAPTALLPHRLQVLVHGLGWLTVGGGLTALYDHFYPEKKKLRRQRHRLHLAAEEEDEKEQKEAKNEPVRGAASTEVHHHHHHDDAFWPWLVLMNRSPPPAPVVIHNHVGTTDVATTIEHSNKKKADRPNHLAAGVLDYESPGWGPLLVLGAGSVWGIYKLWQILYRRSCQAFGAEVL